MAKCFHCHRTAVPGYSLCKAHLKSSQNGTWCGINGVYKPVRECKLNHAICECGFATGSALWERLKWMPLERALTMPKQWRGKG